jgi:hypothetical protein
MNLPVKDHARSSFKIPCNVDLEHVLLPELNLWKNPAHKVHQIIFCADGITALSGTYFFSIKRHEQLSQVKRGLHESSWKIGCF